MLFYHNPLGKSGAPQRDFRYTVFGTKKAFHEKNILILAAPLLCTGCPACISCFHDKYSLNEYNTYWDNFSGSLKKGCIYHYNNQRYDKKLRFFVLQVLDKNTVLVIRHQAWNMNYDDLCDEALFLVISDTLYADLATLQDGDYICTGTYTYETTQKTQKTVYVLAEKSFFEKKALEKEKAECKR